MREICMSGSMSGVWRRGHGRTSKAPPDERGGNGYVRPTATAPHLDSTDYGGSPSATTTIHGLSSNVDLFRDRQGIIHLVAQIAHRALQPGAAQRQLDRSRIAGASIDQGDLCPSRRMCSAGRPSGCYRCITSSLLHRRQTRTEICLEQRRRLEARSNADARAEFFNMP
jgi:hypothetical protein